MVRPMETIVGGVTGYLVDYAPIELDDYRNHVYSMSTGNSKVDSIMWHESTSSLIRTTRYEYDNGSVIMDWPSRAYHDEHYCGYSWDIVLKKPCILQYMFQNGKNMNMEIEANLAKRPKIF
jgi:hypothetical protein